MNGQRPSNTHLSPPTEFEHGRYGWPDLFWATGDMPYNQAMAWCEHHRSRAHHFERMLQLRTAHEPPAAPMGHEDAQSRILAAVREVQVLCDAFGYDPNEWLRADDDRPAGNAWLVADAGGTGEHRFRTLKQGMSAWTLNPSDALQFARRVDAEKYAEEDEDAWHIFPVPGSAEPPGHLRQGMEAVDASELTVDAIRKRAAAFNHWFRTNGGFKGYEAQAIDALLDRIDALETLLPEPPSVLPPHMNAVVLYERSLEGQGWCNIDNEIWRERAKHGEVRMFVDLFAVEAALTASTKEGSHE